METQYSVFFPNLGIPAALSRRAKGVPFVVGSFGYAWGFSDASALVFEDTSYTSN
jgi:hypothetical protein